MFKDDLKVIWGLEFDVWILSFSKMCNRFKNSC